MAEALLNHWGKGKFRAYSAGSHPAETVHPLTLELLERLQLPTDGLRSKSWDELATPTSPGMDFIITVCDNAAGEVCPVWPGKPIAAHWGFPDPAGVEGTIDQQRRAFADVYRSIEARVKLFCSLPLEALDRMGTQSKPRLGQGENVKA